MKKKAAAVGAIETIRDKEGHVVKLSVTFLNNANTWAKDHAAECSCVVLDCRKYKDAASPMKALWQAIAAAHDGLDVLFISSHSDWEGLYIFSKIRKELAEADRYITLGHDWSGIKFNPGARIIMGGCQAGGRFGKKWPTSIAQQVADKTGVSVWAYLSRTAQKRRPDGGFYQRPDTGVLTEFTPQRTENSTKESEEKQDTTPS